MSSKFKGLLDAAKGKESEPEELEAKQPQLVEDVEQPLKRGRPKGKRSHPDYEQVTAYIRKDTHRSAKIALLREGEEREFSELIQELLEEWLKLRT